MTEIQEKIIKTLKETTENQAFGSYFDSCGAYCANGIIGVKVLGLDLVDDECDIWAKKLDEVLGDYRTEIVKWNDGLKLTFSQIAAKLEDLWK